jgi:hypothetical protein
LPGNLEENPRGANGRREKSAEKIEKKQKKKVKNRRRKKEPGYSAEGPRNPGLSCPPPQ